MNNNDWKFAEKVGRCVITVLTYVVPFVVMGAALIGIIFTFTLVPVPPCLALTCFGAALLFGFLTWREIAPDHDNAAANRSE